MDMQKMQVRADLERMVINYFLLGEITEDQSADICNFIDNTIGGSYFPEPGERQKGAIIPFPTSYTGQQNKNETWMEKLDREEQEKKEQAEERAAREKLLIIYAPYDKPLPEGVPDFRQVLQRDGLALICYQKLSSNEGVFYDALWAKSNNQNNRRDTEWSGATREEDLSYVMPRDVGYSQYEHEKATLCYTVRVAPENVLDGPISDFFAYIKTLKAAGIKNSEGENVNFDYVFNFAVEKRNRFLLKNNELLTLKLPARVISVLDERDIHTIHQLKKMSVQELMSIQNIGHKMITETLAILSEAGITLQEEKREGGKYETKIHQA